MKNFTLIAAIFALLMGNMMTVSAQDCGSSWGDCCEWSMLDGKVKIGADWLYWKTQQDNMGNAALVSIDSTAPLVTSLHVVEPKFEYTSGYRVWVGYELPCNCWEANVIYTYIPAKMKRHHIDAVDGFAITPATVGPLSTLIGAGEILSVDRNWDLAINNIDVDIARNICFNECISIRPHIGFRSLWFTDKHRANVFGAFEFEPTDSLVEIPFNSFNACAVNKFKGYGIEGGLWGAWQIGCGFSLVGHFGGSILYSKFTVHEMVEGREVIGDVSSDIFGVNLSNSIRTSTPTMDYFLGLQFADQMCDMSFAIIAGYEQHIIFYTNRIAGNGNLSTGGLTLGLQVGF